MKTPAAANQNGALVNACNAMGNQPWNSSLSIAIASCSDPTAMAEPK